MMSAYMKVMLQFLICLLAFGTVHSATLEVRIKDKVSTKGSFYYLVFKSDKGFPDVKKESAYLGTFSAKENSLTIEDVPPGAYALTIFQDENESGKLDTNFLGIPKESFGFSNNPKILMGAPSFEKCRFQIQDTTVIEIKMRQF